MTTPPAQPRPAGPSGTQTARLARIRLHPIKSLDPVDVAEARIGPNGGLELDRAWALYTSGPHSSASRLHNASTVVRSQNMSAAPRSHSTLINGKRTPAVHLLRALFAPDVSSVTLSVPGDRRNIPVSTFAFPGDLELAARWFSDYFELPVIVRYAREGFPDDELSSGPTIVSTASLEAVCEWFPGVTLEEARRRFRTTLEVHGVPAFWEDRLFGAEENYPVRFRIGQVAFEGSNPCARCPVPSRDPQSGAPTEGFQKRFSELRRAALPSWSPAARFDHFYRIATNTRVPYSECGKTLRVGDPVDMA